MTFGVVALWCRGSSWLSVAFTALQAVSVLNHARLHEQYPGKRLVHMCDKLLVHGIGLGCLYTAIREQLSEPPPVALQSKMLFVFWTSMLYINVVYYVFHKRCCTTAAWEKWHISIHIVGALGAMALHNATEQVF
jgi:xanthosine utilization system XapX-like protein